MTRAGMEPDSVPPHQLRPAPALVNDVAERLLTAFNTSDLAEHAFVTHAGCEGSSCAMEVTFNDVRSAIEHEMQLTRWLSEGDSSCSFTLNPLAIDSMVSSANSSRGVSGDCG